MSHRIPCDSDPRTRPRDREVASTGAVLAARTRCAMALLVLASGASPASAELLQLDAWSTGETAVFQAGFVAGETAAVRLVPTGPCPCQLDEVRFLFGGAGTSHNITIRIWDDSAGTTAPGAELYSTLAQDMSRDCDTFMSINGVNSLYFWTGMRPPTGSNMTVWPALLPP